MNIAHVNESQFELTQDRIEAKDKAIKIADEIAAKEADCLKTIHTRYCIIKWIPILLTDVSSSAPLPNWPNYREYHYKHGTKDVYFLMSRNLEVDDKFNPKLTITFNKELIREGE